MIRRHEANSGWWGEPVGVLDDAGFFALEAPAQRQALDEFSFVEFKAPLEAAPPAAALARAGFLLADVQIPFRIALAAVPPVASLAGYACRSAAEEAFEVRQEHMRGFAHERFTELPGMTIERLNARYATWSNQLIERSPGWCLRLSHGGVTQGWFLAEPAGSGLFLALAMLAERATVSGQHLYQCAMNEFAQRGAGVGQASFSVRNTAVLNIYARLGARFTPAVGVWQRLRDDQRTGKGQ